MKLPPAVPPPAPQPAVPQPPAPAPAAPAAGEGEGDGLARNAAAGLSEGVYGTLGFPVDAATWLVNRGIDGVNAVTGADIANLQDLPLGSRSIATNLEHYAGIPDPAKVRAVTLAEKAARAAGEGAAYAIAPQALLRAGAVAAGTRLLPALETLFGNANSVGRLAGDALAGGIGGGAGTLAGEAAPEPLKPLAEFGGNLAGGGLVAAAEHLPQLIAQGGRAIRDYAEPLIGGLSSPPAHPAMAPAGGAPPVRPPNAYENRIAPPERAPAARAVPETPPGWSNVEIFAPPDPAAGRFRTDYPDGAPRTDAFERDMLRQDGGYERGPIPRTPGLGTHASMQELLEIGALPGQAGVILTDPHVSPGDVYKLSTMNGRRVEFSLIRDEVDGVNVLKLYSGTAWRCPYPMRGHIVGHTHPNETATQKWPSPEDMRILNERYFAELDMNPNARPRPSLIIWGPGQEDNTKFYPGFWK